MHCMWRRPAATVITISSWWDIRGPFHRVFSSSHIGSSVLSFFDCQRLTSSTPSITWHQRSRIHWPLHGRHHRHMTVHQLKARGSAYRIRPCSYWLATGAGTVQYLKWNWCRLHVCVGSARTCQLMSRTILSRYCLDYSHVMGRWIGHAWQDQFLYKLNSIINIPQAAVFYSMHAI